MSPIFTRVAENPGISFHSKYYIKAWLFPRSKKLKSILLEVNLTFTYLLVIGMFFSILELSTEMT